MTVSLVLVGRSSDIPLLEGRTVTVEGRRIAVFHTRRGFRALDAACPHQGGPLADGLVTDACVTCPLHGWRFDLESGRVHGRTERVETYGVFERDGELWLAIPAELALAA